MCLDPIVLGNLVLLGNFLVLGSYVITLQKLHLDGLENIEISSHLVKTFSDGR